MNYFNNYDDFKYFKNEVLNKNRYFFGDKVKLFLGALEKKSRDNIYLLKSTISLFRARIDHKVEGYDDYYPIKMKEMYPFQNKSKEGRANPKGISYFYCSDNKDTSISETRPWLYQYITLAEFKPKKDIKLINFIYQRKTEIDKSLLFKGAVKYEIDERVWKDISMAFSYPIVNNEFDAYYSPTQIITEFIKKIGYDGIIYKSLLGEGHNICLFNYKKVQPIKSELFVIEKINLKKEFVSNNERDNEKIVL